MSQRPLRVGFDIRALTSPAAAVRRYVRELASALLDLDVPTDLVALGGRAPHATWAVYTTSVGQQP